MNLINAYLRSRNQPRITRNLGILPMTYEVLQQILELPPGVYLRDIHANYAMASLDFILESRAPVPDITYELREGAMIPRINPEAFINILQR